MKSDSTFVRHVACPACGSQDNAGVFTDGHLYCFGCEHHENNYEDGPGGPRAVADRRGGAVADLLPVDEYAALPSRKITQDTAEHFKYGVGFYKGKPAQIAPYYDRDGSLVAQKVRGPNKQFAWLGAKPEDCMPFGYFASKRGGKFVILTEGEIDALSASQVNGNKHPVWSIPTGAGPQLKKWLAHVKAEGVFDGFESVVVMFDNDDTGRKAAADACQIIGAKAKVAELSLKDANEMLVAGLGEELYKAPWNAKPYRPEGILEASALRAEEAATVENGLDYPWAAMNRITYGARTGELVGVGAGAGAGKTDFLTEYITHFISVHGEPMGGFFLESTPVELIRRVLGKLVSKPFHIPNAGWTEDDKAEAWAQLQAAAPLFLYDSFGVNEWEPIKAKMEYLHHAHGVRYFVLDHLTAFAAHDPQNERQILEGVMGDMGSFVKKLPINIHFVSHLATPEGKPHEEGGHISLRHFKGARAIGFWAHAAFGIERNQQAEDPSERHVSTIRCVKNRKIGHMNGETFKLRYEADTGRLRELGDNPFTEDAAPEDGGRSDF